MPRAPRGVTGEETISAPRCVDSPRERLSPHCRENFVLTSTVEVQTSSDGKLLLTSPAHRLLDLDSRGHTHL